MVPDQREFPPRSYLMGEEQGNPVAVPLGRPEVTKAELHCGNRMTREANATRVKAQRKPRTSGNLHASGHNSVDTRKAPGPEREPTRVR